ncbi:MAG: flagellar basal body-associated FliL family protein [Rhodobacteraceae bacterium]|nr:flagellar basal body-associated FliL family protein [Paracoccaceae bacterium]
MSDARANSKAPAGRPGAQPPRSLWRRLSLVLGLVVLAGGATVGGLMLAMGPSTVIGLVTGTPAVAAADPAGKSPQATDDAGGIKAAGGRAEIMPFKEIIVNITAVTASGRRTSRFLKLNVALVYDAARDADGLVSARQLYMRDAFQDYLRQLTERDLQGTQGLLTLKEELLRRARAIAGNDAPREILVADLIVQ